MYRQIINGPGKFDLMLSLFEGKEITFTLEKYAEHLLVREVTAALNSLAIEEGGRNGWLFDGWHHLGKESHHFHGYYYLPSRKGWLRYDRD